MDVGIPNFDFLSLVQQCGFPIALAVVCGWFILQAIKLVLGSIVKSIKKMTFLIKSMHGRVDQMNADIIEIDRLISDALYVDTLPQKDHYQVAAIMNSHDVKPATESSKKQTMRKMIGTVGDKLK